MSQANTGVMAVVDLAALQKRIALDGIYNHVPQAVTEARQTMLYAMERHDVARINEVIHDLDQKIRSMAAYGVKADAGEIEAYRHIINIGRVALHGIPDSGYSTTKPAQPIRKWDA